MTTDEKIQAILLKHTGPAETQGQRALAAYREVYEQGYVDGKEMERRLLRLKLGLGVPEDEA